MRKPQDEFFMRQALALAQKGAGRVSPNPLVGCVVVWQGKAIGQGWHKRFGDAHAEVNALRGIKTNGATLYVTLEPCFHFGKTPPCVEVLIAAKIKRVVIGLRDPNPLTNGKSIRKLQAAGIEVAVGVCAAEAQELNKFFLKATVQKMPYVICKVAQSLDGKIGLKGKRTQITGPRASHYVQRLRAQVDALLVGRNTVSVDDPQLNVRRAESPQPKRVILDTDLKTSVKSRLFAARGGEVIFFTALPPNDPRAHAFMAKGVTVVRVQKNSKDKLNLKEVLKKLFARGVTSILVEGGAEVFSSFFDERLADEWQVISAPVILGDAAIPALTAKFCATIPMQEMGNLGRDRLYIFDTNRGGKNIDNMDNTT